MSQDAIELQVSRPTATKYLDQLSAEGFVSKHKVGRDKYYINEPRGELLVQDHLPESK